MLSKVGGHARCAVRVAVLEAAKGGFVEMRSLFETVALLEVAPSEMASGRRLARKRVRLLVVLELALVSNEEQVLGLVGSLLERELSNLNFLEVSSALTFLHFLRNY